MSFRFSSRAVALSAAISAVLLAVPCEAQQRRGKFPTWERDVDTSQLAPLPEARTGRHSVSLSIELPSVATGVASMPGQRLASALPEGRVLFHDIEGEPLGEVDASFALSWPPQDLGDRVLVAGPGAIAAVSTHGLEWVRPLPAEPALAPSRRPGAVLVLCADGTAIAWDDDGNEQWRALLDGEAVTAGPAWTSEAVLFGDVGGNVRALSATDGSELWRTKVGERVHGLGTDGRSAYVSTRGFTGRSKRSAGPVLARLPLGEGGRSARSLAWRLRVGGISTVPPLFLDELVAFPCWHGYVHAITRRKGNGGWRMDLPARLRHPPVTWGGRLDFVLALTPHVVALASENGAVMGHFSLEDEDEAFLGPAVSAGGLTISATSLGRIVGLRWEQ